MYFNPKPEFNPPVKNRYIENPLGEKKRWRMDAARIIAVLVAVAYGVVVISFSVNNLLMFIVAAYCSAFIGLLAYVFWVYIRIKLKADNEASEIRKNKEELNDI